MKSTSQPNHLCSSALLKWGDAGEKLAIALSAYLQSCVFLETFSSLPNPDSKTMVPIIDGSLNTLHTKLSEELTQSRLILTRMRNKISSRSYSLPNEVLAEIFKDVVFTPGPGEDRFPSMADGLKRVFVRLHSLVAVCSTWRNVGIALSELWSIIPVVDDELISPALKATSLALQRSQPWNSSHRRLQLAAVLSNPYTPVPPFMEGVPQFTSINIEAPFKQSTHAISRLLERVLESQSTSVMSELSVDRYHDLPENKTPLRFPQNDEYLCSHISAERRILLARLIGSLSILRLRSTNIRWDTITFSDKLVELHLQSLVIGNHYNLKTFLRVLESAPELRDVRLTSVVAFLVESSEELEWFTPTRPEKISLPKLESLSLEDLTFNVLEHVLTSLSPSSHRLKVRLTPKCTEIYLSPGDLEPEDTDGQSVVDLLNISNIDTLFLSADDRVPWATYGLRPLLRSLPSLKTLILTSWKFDDGSLDSILALEQPDSGTPFPDLSKLYILGGQICNMENLSDVVASHYSLQTLVLDSRPGRLVGEDVDDVVEWLRSEIPDFRLVPDIKQLDDFNYHWHAWRLW